MNTYLGTITLKVGIKAKTKDEAQTAMINAFTIVNDGYLVDSKLEKLQELCPRCKERELENKEWCPNCGLRPLFDEVEE